MAVQATLAMPSPDSQRVRLQQQQHAQAQQLQQQQRQLSGKDVEQAAMQACIRTATSVPAEHGVLDPAGLRWKGSALDAAYERCGSVCQEYAKTFFLGTQLMTPVQARCIWAIYVWCRRTDELVDGPNASKITPQVRCVRMRGEGGCARASERTHPHTSPVRHRMEEHTCSGLHTHTCTEQREQLSLALWCGVT